MYKLICENPTLIVKSKDNTWFNGTILKGSLMLWISLSDVYMIVYTST